MLIKATALRVSIKEAGALESWPEWSVVNRFEVRDQDDNPLFTTGEVNVINGKSCNVVRPFKIKIKDNIKTPVLYFEREFQRAPVYHSARPQDIVVKTAAGVRLGMVERISCLFKQEFVTKTAQNCILAKIHGPWLPFNIHCDPIKFYIESHNHRQVGCLTKEPPEFRKGVYHDMDVFEISFCQQYTVNNKSLFLAALFLIVYGYPNR